LGIRVGMLVCVVAPVWYFRVFMLLGIRVGMLLCVVAPVYGISVCLCCWV